MNNMDLPPDIRIEAGETVYWVGAPDVRRSNSDVVAATCLFVGGMGFFALVVLAQISSANVARSAIVPIFWGLVALAAVLGPVAARQRRAARYVITNRRVVLFRPGNTEPVTSIAFADLRNVKAAGSATTGIGEIDLRSQKARVRFRNLPRAKAVYDALMRVVADKAEWKLEEADGAAAAP